MGHSCWYLRRVVPFAPNLRKRENMITDYSPSFYVCIALIHGTGQALAERRRFADVLGVTGDPVTQPGPADGQTTLLPG